MDTRQLVHRCQHDDNLDCFDLANDHIRAKKDCGARELCPRGSLGHRVTKTYEEVADATKRESAKFGDSI